MDLSLLKQLHIEPNNGPLVLALSGGVDSMVLFDVLRRADYKLIIAHVNHQVRKESNAEYLAIANLASQHGFHFEGHLLHETTTNFHHEAHHARVEFFVSVAKKFNAQAVLTAHHSDDQIESVLFKIARGSNLSGYAGMSPSVIKDDVLFLKPFLNITKENILEYAKHHLITYYEDASNASLAYARNTLRHLVLKPYLSAFPDIHSKIQDYEEQLHRAHAFIRESALAFIDSNSFHSKSQFLGLHDALKHEVIACLLEAKHVDNSMQKIKDILVFLRETSGSKSLSVGSGYALYRVYDSFYLANVLSPLNNDEITVDDFGSYALQGIGTFHFVKNVANAHTFHIKLCYNERAFPFTIRTRKNGDYITMPYGTKKIKDLMIDAKIPKHSRDYIPLLVSSNDHILWIPGYAKSAEVLSEGNNVMYVVYEQGD